MSSIQGEVYRAFRKINVPEQEAMDAAVSGLKSDMIVVKSLLGVNMAMLLAVFVKLFIHG
jgi:hypothetical protein